MPPLAGLRGRSLWQIVRINPAEQKRITFQIGEYNFGRESRNAARPRQQLQQFCIPIAVRIRHDPSVRRGPNTAQKVQGARNFQVMPLGNLVRSCLSFGDLVSLRVTPRTDSRDHQN